jgi:hypothetical protein
MNLYPFESEYNEGLGDGGVGKGRRTGFVSTAAIAHTAHSSLLLDAIAAREHELHQITRRLQTAARSTIARARAELAKHTTEIRMTPEVSTDGTLQYVAEGEWNFFGGTDFAVVAGVGFEPTTFGL